MKVSQNLKHVMKPIGQARGLPNEHYTTWGSFNLEKEKLLFSIEPCSTEGTFSLNLKHWFKHPIFSIQFYSLVRKENSYIRKNFEHSFLIRFWRSIHIALSVVFFLGLIAHIVVVTFFAAYVSDGSDIYWWHISK